MNILITGVGGPTPRSFAIAIKKIGRYKDARLIGTDINPRAVGLYQRDLFDETYVIPRADAADYWKVVEELVKREKIDLAIILPELEVMEWAKKASTGALPCTSFLPDIKMAEALVDKGRMTQLLEETGLVPSSFGFSPRQGGFEKISEVCGSPYWVRSASGTSGLGSMLIETQEQLITWMSINPGVSNYLASEYLPGRNLACKLLYNHGKLLRAACAERVNYIMAKVAPSGITGNTSFGRLLNEPKLVELGKKALEIISEKLKCELHGFFTVDFKEDREKKPLITEINVRHVAFTQCFAAGGANLAEDTIRLLTGDPEFDMTYKMYEFEPGLIFLRDVDALPIIMKEDELLSV